MGADFIPASLFVMDFFQALAERRICEALENGDLDNLPNRGRRLDFSEEHAIPEDLKMAFHLLKTAGYVPDELSLAREMEEIQRRVEQTNSSREVNALKKALREKRLAFEIAREKRLHGRLIL